MRCIPRRARLKQQSLDRGDVLVFVFQFAHHGVPFPSGTRSPVCGSGPLGRWATAWAVPFRGERMSPLRQRGALLGPSWPQGPEVASLPQAHGVRKC